MKKILIVDDSQEWMNFHKNTLLEIFDDISITQAYSAKDGLSKALKEAFNVILCDMEMEELFDERYAGMWLIRQLKQQKHLNKTNIIAVSGAYDIEEIAKILDVKFIAKSDLLNNQLLLKYKIEEKI